MSNSWPHRFVEHSAEIVNDVSFPYEGMLQHGDLDHTHLECLVIRTCQLSDGGGCSAQLLRVLAV